MTCGMLDVVLEVAGRRTLVDGEGVFYGDNG